ncbi:MAG TPA: rhodanese-like domain-containing protein [Thiolinea sp.]|nr:rhodanese-like domain-containing protein [Thiolinea sp.]
MLRKVLLLSCLLLLTSPAFAIPPPDVVASLWQAILQMIGIASVFLAGAWVAARQFLSQHAPILKRKIVFIPILIVLLILSILAISPLFAAAANEPIKGELLPIETVIQREKDTWVRDWKLKTVHEMENEARLTRAAKQLPVVQYQTIQSFTPKALQELLTTRAKDVYVLDIREAMELSKFSIRHDAVFRYGDLVQDLLPNDLPKDRLIVVLCHSGLRGYMGAQFLKHAGFEQVAFLQGGLAEWNKQGLPVNGRADFKVKAPVQPSKKEALAMDAYKVQVDPAGTATMSIPNVVQLPYETASTADLQPVLAVSKTKPVLIVCKEYGGCFQGLNLIWLIEQQGGKVAGLYDQTGQHLRGLIN